MKDFMLLEQCIYNRNWYNYFPSHVFGIIGKRFQGHSCLKEADGLSIP